MQPIEYEVLNDYASNPSRRHDLDERRLMPLGLACHTLLLPRSRLAHEIPQLFFLSHALSAWRHPFRSSRRHTAFVSVLQNAILRILRRKALLPFSRHWRQLNRIRSVELSYAESC